MIRTTVVGALVVLALSLVAVSLGSTPAAATGTSPTVVSSSIEHVGGTEPDMENVTVDPTVQDTHLMVHVDALDPQLQQETEEKLPREELTTGELSTVGVDHSTVFEVELVVESFTPRMLVGRSRGMDWDRTFREDGTVVVTVEASPSTKQTNGEDPPLDDWPTGEDDRATHSVDESVQFALRSFADHPGSLAESINGTVVGSDAQVVGTPALRTDEQSRPRLEITVAGPHYTADGDVNDGYYYAVLSPSLLEAWNVSEPGQLVAWYDGDRADFSAERVGDAIRIELDVQYSVATVSIGRAESPTDAGQPNNSSDSSQPDTSSGPDQPNNSSDSGQPSAPSALVPIVSVTAGLLLLSLGGADRLRRRRERGEG